MCTQAGTLCPRCVLEHTQYAIHACDLTHGVHARVHTDVLFAVGALPVFFTLQKEGFFVCRPEFSPVKVKEDYTVKLYNINHGQY